MIVDVSPFSSSGPLADTLVVDLSRALAGPQTTMMLADLGARVIKDEAERGTLLQMVDRVDVLVENFRTGVLDRLGTEVLRTDHAAPPTLDQHGVAVRAWLAAPDASS